MRTKLARNTGKRADDKARPLASRRDVPRGGCAQDQECAPRIDIHMASGEAQVAQGSADHLGSSDDKWLPDIEYAAAAPRHTEH